MKIKYTGNMFQLVLVSIFFMSIFKFMSFFMIIIYYFILNYLLSNITLNGSKLVLEKSKILKDALITNIFFISAVLVYGALLFFEISMPILHYINLLFLLVVIFILFLWMINSYLKNTSLNGLTLLDSNIQLRFIFKSYGFNILNIFILGLILISTMLMYFNLMFVIIVFYVIYKVLLYIESISDLKLNNALKYNIPVVISFMILIVLVFNIYVGQNLFYDIYKQLMIITNDSISEIELFNISDFTKELMVNITNIFDGYNLRLQLLSSLFLYFIVYTLFFYVVLIFNFANESKIKLQYTIILLSIFLYSLMDIFTYGLFSIVIYVLLFNLISKEISR